MDTSRIGRGRGIAAAGGLVLIVSLFINWAAGEDAFQAFSAVDILMLLVGIAALVYGLVPAAGAERRLPSVTPWIVAGLGLAVFGWAIGFEFEVSGDFGVWLAILASLGIAYGAYETAAPSGLPPAPAARGSAEPPPVAGSPPPPPPGR